MSQEHIAKVVAGPSATEADTVAMLERVQAFFSRYETLADFKHRTEDQLMRDGYVETAFGNRRYRVSEGRLTGNERRWAISQVIQGNASLVFKEAVRNLATQFGSSAVVLPMHDAVLMQFEVGTAREKASQASEIMREAFKSRFPQVTPRVSVERFALAAENASATTI
jgi:DNA polymerase I-like protein with 3'-5' exonuclease and polymerase domains